MNSHEDRVPAVMKSDARPELLRRMNVRRILEDAREYYRTHDEA